jgi:F-box interacting protein
MALTNAKKVSSGTTYIPEDIVFSILSKLPIKSLKRFSSVQKSWSRLFEKHIFIDMFRNNLLSKSHSLYDGVSLILNLIQELYHWNFYLLSDGKFENKLKLDFPYVFHPHASIVCVLGSAINGILCIYDYNHSSYTKAVLWKFVTGEVMVIPISNLSYEFRYVYVTLHGFGYDHVRDDYKVIQHAAYIKYNPSYDGKWKNFWEIYSLKSNSWRKLGFDMPTRYRRTNGYVYMNGVCHWLGETIDETCVTIDEKCVVSFNLSNEVFIITPLPPDCFDVNLVVLNGSFTLISNYKKTESFHISILGEFGVKESWVRLFDIGPLSCIDIPIGARKDTVFFKRKNDELVCFNLTTGMIEEIGVKGEKCWCQMIVYKENLHPIEGMNN